MIQEGMREGRRGERKRSTGCCWLGTRRHSISFSLTQSTTTVASLPYLSLGKSSLARVFAPINFFLLFRVASRVSLSPRAVRRGRGGDGFFRPQTAAISRLLRPRRVAPALTLPDRRDARQTDGDRSRAPLVPQTDAKYMAEPGYLLAIDGHLIA